MTIARLQLHQNHSWAAYLGALVDCCARKYKGATSLVSLDYEHPIYMGLKIVNPGQE